MSQSVRAIAPTLAVNDGIPSSTAAPSKPQPGTIPIVCLQPVLAAFNATNLASGYLERGNIPAARRKLVQALAFVNQASEGGAQ